MLFGSSTLFAQENAVISQLAKKMISYGVKKTPSGLFCHFDKTIYTENESVWFTAYLLNYSKHSNDPGILAIALVNSTDNSIIFSRQYVMNKALAFGHLFIPASIVPGDYFFLIYTNVLVNGIPRDVFSQSISIKSTMKPNLQALLTVDTTLPANYGFRKVMLKVTLKDGTPVSGADVNYKIGHNRYPLLSGNFKTDKDGRYIFSIPAGQIRSKGSLLTATVTYKKESSNIKLTIPVDAEKMNVKFYPEGGNLVHATQSLIGWEVKGAYGAPVAASGILYRDKIPIDTIYTDRYGLGKFKLIPLVGSTYKVKLIGSENDTSYQLPNILIKGPVISLKKAIADDSLQIHITSKYPEKYLVLVHNYRQTFFSFPVDVGAAGKTALIILKDIPKGLNTITILDSLQRPCAERLFFAHYSERDRLDISTDKLVYAPRQKVILKLKLNSPAVDTLKGAISIACVQSSRIEGEKFNNIESYVYLNRELEAMPYRTNYLGQNAADLEYLENVLLVKGWRRYNWQEMLETSEKDTLSHADSITSINGTVSKSGKPLKGKVDVLVLRDTTTQIISTDGMGHFVLTNNVLFTPEGKKIRILSNSHNNNTLSLTNPFNEINKSLASALQANNNDDLSSPHANSNSFALTDLKHSIILKEVVIRAGADRREDGSLYSSVGPNECGDYVCRYNILDCPNHLNESDNHPPVKGQSYSVLLSMINNETMLIKQGILGHKSTTGFEYRDIIYTGCMQMNPNPSMLTIDGICFSKKFYPEDYSQFNQPDPDYLSTIYWKHYTLVNSKHDTELSFYTGDITGKFKIIVQGVTTNDVVYGEKEFNVVEKQ